MSLEPVAERLAVELSLPALKTWVCRDRECEANALPLSHCGGVFNFLRNNIHIQRCNGKLGAYGNIFLTNQGFLIRITTQKIPWSIILFRTQTSLHHVMLDFHSIGLIILIETNRIAT